MLPKDQWKDLYDGDCFSLLPDDLVFRVMYPRREKKDNGASRKDPLDELFDPTDKSTTEGTPLAAAPVSCTADVPFQSNTLPSVKERDETIGAAAEVRDVTTETQSPVHQKMCADEVDKTNVSVSGSKPSLSSTQSGSTGRKRALPSWLSGLSCDDGTNKTLSASKKRKAPSTKVAVTESKVEDDEIDSPPPKVCICDL